MNRYTLTILILTTILLGTLRLAGFASPAFQAFAHLFVGGLVTLAIVRRSWCAGGLAIAITAVEVFAFFTLGD